MGNCQAIDAASLVIQHPTGRVERLYWPVTVSEVMRMNKGHYVALVITLGASEEEKSDNNGVRITRVKLLRPTDTLVLGHAYRLITSEEVIKGLREKKYAKLKKKEAELAEKPQRVMMEENRGSGGCEIEAGRSKLEKTNQGPKHERNRQRTTSSASARPKTWRPSLQSISEAAS